MRQHDLVAAVVDQAQRGLVGARGGREEQRGGKSDGAQRHGVDPGVAQRAGVGRGLARPRAGGGGQGLEEVAGGRDGAAAALRHARQADVAAVQDQPVVRVVQVLRRHALEQLQLDRQRRLARRQAGAVGDAEHVRVDRQRRLAERHVEDHVGRLAAHAGQGLQRGAVARHLAAVLLDQEAAGLEQVLGLRAVQADRAHVRLDALGAQRQHALRRGRRDEQRARGLVDADVGGLRRQQHRGQQLEHAGVVQLGGRAAGWRPAAWRRRSRCRRASCGWPRWGVGEPAPDDGLQLDQQHAGEDQRAARQAGRAEAVAHEDGAEGRGEHGLGRQHDGRIGRPACGAARPPAA